MTKRKEYNEYDLERVLGRARVIPDAECYAYRNGNYGAHAMKFVFLGIQFWFSYGTLIAFQVPGGKRIKRANDWNNTTGYHLGQVGGGWENQYPAEEFWVLFAQAMRDQGFKGIPNFCVFEEKPKPPKRKLLRKVGLKKKHEPVVPPPPIKPGDFYKFPKKPTAEQRRLADLTSNMDFERYRNELPEGVLP